MKTPRIYRSAFLAVLLLIISTSCNLSPLAPHASQTPAPTSAPSATPLLPPASPIPSLTPLPAVPPGFTERTLTVGDLQRTYLLHLPSDLNPSQTAPLVFIFHGWRNDALTFQPPGILELADQNGFLVLIPSGSGADDDTAWNAGGCCGTAAAGDVDEIAFVRQVLSDVGTLVKVDPKRIYAAGFSNGGMLAYRLACQMADTFAAVAAVSGTLFYSPCLPAQPVSILHIHGLEDVIVPFSGGGELIPGGFPAVEQGIHTWVGLDGCRFHTKTERLNTPIAYHTYTSCQSDSAVELYTIQSLGHGWPTIPEFPTAAILWDFFADHPKP